MTILNSNYEAWRDQFPDKSYLEFDFDPKDDDFGLWG